MSNNNGYKAQYKSASNQQWQTKTSGTEQSCMQQLEKLRNDYTFARVIDSEGRVVS